MRNGMLGLLSLLLTGSGAVLAQGQPYGPYPAVPAAMAAAPATVDLPASAPQSAPAITDPLPGTGMFYEEEPASAQPPAPAKRRGIGFLPRSGKDSTSTEDARRPP